MGHTIDGESTFPPLIMNSDHELRFLNPEHGYADDGPFTLELPRPDVALISARDARKYKEGCQPAMKFLAMSMKPGKKIVTAYLAYRYNGPVEVSAWADDKKGLLSVVDMEHVDIDLAQTPERLLERHYEKIVEEEGLITEGLREEAEKTFFDMLWNVRSH